MRYKIKKSLSIIVPCKNEAGNIMSIYNSINISDRKVEILFGDDKSIDSTKEKIFQLIKLNKKKNISLFDDLISKIDKTDIILLPEMFNTSFSPSNIDLSEDMPTCLDAAIAAKAFCTL